MGVDNDELLCRVCSSPLSSVIPNAEKVLFRAAKMLARLMNREKVEDQTQLIQPLGVAARQSTDEVAIDDRDIAAAVIGEIAPRDTEFQQEDVDAVDMIPWKHAKAAGIVLIIMTFTIYITFTNFSVLDP